MFEIIDTDTQAIVAVFFCRPTLADCGSMYPEANALEWRVYRGVIMRGAHELAVIVPR